MIANSTNLFQDVHSFHQHEKKKRSPLYPHMRAQNPSDGRRQLVLVVVARVPELQPAGRVGRGDVYG
jgi:hypothetical protein